MSETLRPFEELTSNWSDERKQHIRQETDAARIELLVSDLAELRRTRGVTQVELAHAIGRTQSTISAMESAGDHRISTLHSVVAALGGTLEITAQFDDVSIRFTG